MRRVVPQVVPVVLAIVEHMGIEFIRLGHRTVVDQVVSERATPPEQREYLRLMEDLVAGRLPPRKTATVLAARASLRLPDTLGQTNRATQVHHTRHHTMPTSTTRGGAQVIGRAPCVLGGRGVRQVDQTGEFVELLVDGWLHGRQSLCRAELLLPLSA